MRFARVVFVVAAAVGLLALIPMYRRGVVSLLRLVGRISRLAVCVLPDCV